MTNLSVSAVLQGPKPSKLEKADILEQTVSHMRELQGRLRLSGASTSSAPLPPSLADTYRAGYQRCLQVVRSFSGLADGPAALPRLVLSLEQGLDHLQSLGAGLGVGVGAGAAYRPPSPHSLSSESPRSEASPHDGWAAGSSGHGGDMDTAQWSSGEGESSDSSADESDVLDLTSHGAEGRDGGDGVWRPW